MRDVEAVAVGDLNLVGIAVLVVQVQGHTGPPKGPIRVVIEAGNAHTHSVITITREVRDGPIIKIPIRHQIRVFLAAGLDTTD